MKRAQLADLARDVAQLERVIRAGAFGTPGRGETILDLAIAGCLDLVPTDLGDLADYLEIDPDLLPAGTPAEGDFDRGRTIAAQLEADFGAGPLPTAADQAKRELRRFRARLARARGQG